MGFTLKTLFFQISITGNLDYVDNSAQYQRVVTFGVAKTDDDGKVVKGKDGIEVKADSKKIAWWNSQRIKGIN